MLVLSRKAGEEIHIGTDTVVVIQSVKGNRVRVAIEAPSETKILRGELSVFGDFALPVGLLAATSPCSTPMGAIRD